MYSCPFCIESYNSIINLKIHCKLKHSIKVHSSFRCRQKLCPRTFTDMYNFLKHLSSSHSNSNITKLEKNDKFSKTRNIQDINKDIVDIENDVIEEIKESNLYADSVKVLPISCAIKNNNTDIDITVEKFAEKVSKTSVLFVANLYSRPSIPRAFCQEMIELMKSLFDCVQILQEKYKSIESNPQLDLCSMFNIFNNAFADHTSEYQTMLYFKTLNTLIEPQEICINASIDSKLTKTGREIVLTNQKIYIVPLEKILKTFLELPDVYVKITSNIQRLKQNEIVTNVVQSKVWQSIEQQYDSDVLPLIIYFDDFEINNPLGTHRGLHKLGAVYCTIGGIDEKNASILENIFLLQLHNVVDYNQVGNKRIFSELINQINKLQTDGIIINIEKSVKKVKFALLHILGDNLGLHAIFGLNTSFNSNYSCRICHVNTKTREKQIIEDAELLRTVENYTADVIEQKYGILEECVFHLITNFHITKNLTVDVMHDLFEGVCRYDLGQLLNKLITKDKLFSLETLNNRIRFFDYGTNYSTNIPPLINVNSINKKHIIYSASEMICFVQYLGLIIGDLVPKKNKTWELYIVLRNMISIIMTQEINNDNITLLTKLISKHHKLYINLFNDTLKPKHHLLLHYPRIMEQGGSLKQMSSIRFEAKHKELKETAKAVSSRRNPAYTLAFKHQLQLNYRFISQKGFEKRLEWGVILYESLTNIELYADFKSILPSISFDNYKCVSWVKVNGTFYKSNMVIFVDNSNCKFAQIKYILKNNLDEIMFIYKQLKVVQLNNHFYAYEIITLQSWGFILHSELKLYKPCNIHLSADGRNYIPVVP